MPAPMPTPAATSAQVPSPTGGPQFDPTKLADIHLPDNINFWPMASGWWILLALIILVIVLIIFMKKRKPAIKPPTGKELKSQAMSELLAIEEVYKTHGEPQEAVKQLSIFLRRYALSLYQRDSVASLTDAQWLNLLDKMHVIQPGKQADRQQFSQKFSELLTKAPYQPADKPVDTQLLSQLFQTSKTLVKTRSTLSGQAISSLESEHV